MNLFCSVVILAGNLLALAANAPSRLVLYDLPTPKSAPCSMDVGPDGKTMWYYDEINNLVGRVDPVSGNISTQTVPYRIGPVGAPISANNHTAVVCSVSTGKDGFVYIVSTVRWDIARINPNTSAIEILPIPNPSPVGPQPGTRGWAAKEGLWMTDAGEGRIFFFKHYDFQNRASFTTLNVFDFPVDLRTDKDDNVWCTDFYNQKILRINYTAGHGDDTVRTYPVPDNGTYPSALRAETDNGRYLWANAFQQGGLIRIDTRNPASLKTYIYPEGGNKTYPNDNDNDPAGNVWISSLALNRLAYFNPKTGRWTTIHLPGKIHIAQPYDSRVIPVRYGAMHGMWFTAPGTNQIGYYRLNLSPQPEEFDDR